MIKEFRASDGTLVWTSPSAEGGINLGNYMTLSPKEAQALREFFRHERDEELGRWRDPMSPEVVVTEIDHGRVHVYNEATRWYSEFDSAGQDRVHLLTSGDYGLNWPAIRYFTAHPVAKPLPSEPRTAWVDKYGTDIWVVTAAGTLRCVDSPSSDPAKYAPFTQLVKEQSND